MDGINPSGVIYLVANATYVLSYAVSNLFWLRILAIAAGFATLPYLYFQAEPLWLAIFCQFMFIAINVFHLVKQHLKTHQARRVSNSIEVSDLCGSKS